MLAVRIASLCAAVMTAACATTVPPAGEEVPGPLKVYLKQGDDPPVLIGAAPPGTEPVVYGCGPGQRGDVAAFSAWFEQTRGHRPFWIGDGARAAYYFDDDAPFTLMVSAGNSGGVRSVTIKFNDFPPGDPAYPDGVVMETYPSNASIVATPDSRGERKEIIVSGSPSDPRTGLLLNARFQTIGTSDAITFATTGMVSGPGPAPLTWFEVFFVPRRFCIAE